jgi:thiamine biosynthesis lipoprotein
MDTLATAEVWGGATEGDGAGGMGVAGMATGTDARDGAREAIERALGWFGEVERVCSRFDAESELRRLCATVGEPVAVSRLLLEAVRFAVALADVTEGAFDPTVGGAMAARGFDRHWVTGEATGGSGGGSAAGQGQRTDDLARGTWRDVRVDMRRGAITLARRALLDLGAVAKGLAIDLAARELAGFEGACVEAGGDLHVRGTNAGGDGWRIGVRDPARPEDVACVIELDTVGGAVCTSGLYERRGPGGEEHVLDARNGEAPAGLASVTVVAPTAMAADGLGTAALVLGMEEGARLLEQEGGGAVLIDALGRRRVVGGLRVRDGMAG